MLDAIGVEAFAERARRELAATGETARKRTVETSSELTARSRGLPATACQTRRSAVGCSSARAVQYHLGKVFAKLAISSRSQLDRVLPGDRDTARPR